MHHLRCNPYEGTLTIETLPTEALLLLKDHSHPEVVEKFSVYGNEEIELEGTECMVVDNVKLSFPADRSDALS